MYLVSYVYFIYISNMIYGGSDLFLSLFNVYLLILYKKFCYVP